LWAPTIENDFWVLPSSLNDLMQMDKLNIYNVLPAS
jgi:hypothetical protein